MSTLLLVRHGQASFHEPEYDQLCAQGKRQAELLGESWLRVGVAPDEVRVGPRSRQQATAEAVGEVFVRSGRPWPEPVLVPELDEYAADAMLQAALPQVGSRPRIARAMLAFERAADPSERLRAFQRMFEAISVLWVEGEVLCPDVESWPEFASRIARVLEQLTAGPRRGRTVAVFTSAGVVGAALQCVLGLRDVVALGLSSRVWNSSVTELTFDGTRITMSGFNSIAHLPDRRDWTYR